MPYVLPLIATLYLLMWGQVPALRAQTVVLDPIEVTAPADAVHRVGDVDFEEQSSFATVIPRDDFAARLTSLAEVIEKESGVQVRQSGGLGSFSTVSLRGASSQQVLIYVDGLPLNEAAGGAVDLSQLSLSEVQAIEVYRGIIPVQFASASIGGAINIRTLRPSGKNEYSINAGYGSFNTRQIGLSHLGGKSSWETVFSTQYTDTDNDFTFVNDNGTPQNPADDRVERRNNAQVSRLNALFKLGRSFGSDLRLDALINSLDKDQGLPSVDNNPATTAKLDTASLSSNLSISAQGIHGSPWNGRLRAFASQRREEFDDSRGQIGLGAQLTRDKTQRYGLEAFVERVSKRHTLSGVAALSRETYDSRDLSGSREDLEARRVMIESALQATLFYLQDTLLLTPALRYQAHRDTLEGAMDTGSNDYLSPQAGIKYELAEGLFFKANAGRYVRIPSFFELFGDRGFVKGNADLKAEQGVNIDGGIEYRRNFSMDWLREWNLKLNYFHSDIDDLIALVFDARGVGRAVNIASAQIMGVELSTRFGFPSGTSLVLNATWQDPVNRSQVAAFDGKRLPGRYEAMAFLRLEQSIRFFRVYYEFRYESGLFYDSANLLPAKDVREHNIGVEAEYGAARFGFEARNLGDENFQEFNGFPTPGLSLFANLTYRFEF
jgi:iron complex outermembrane receptor protein